MTKSEIEIKARELRNAYHREWCRNNPEKVRAAQERYRKSHPGANAERQRRFWERKAERVLNGNG